MARQRYSDHLTIAASFPSRKPFYRDLDKFYSHPKEFSSIFNSQRNYINDCWFEDRPKNDFFSNSSSVKVEYEMNNLVQKAEGLLEFYRKDLPINTIFHIPWRLNRYDFNKKNYEFGIKDLGNHNKTITSLTKKLFFNRLTMPILGNRYSEIIKMLDSIIFENGVYTKPIELSDQKFERLYSLKEEISSNASIRLSEDSKYISIFPRRRDYRRPDKNFGKENYLKLIKKLQYSFPSHKIILIGEPKGSYFFKNDLPRDCIDLINIQEDFRMIDHVYALSKSDISIGSISGALLIALAAGCKSIMWGYEDTEARIPENNPLNTEYEYINNMNPKIQRILAEVHKLMK